jgi:hypothetical protein
LQQEILFRDRKLQALEEFRVRETELQDELQDMRRQLEDQALAHREALSHVEAEALAEKDR